MLGFVLGFVLDFVLGFVEDFPDALSDGLPEALSDDLPGFSDDLSDGVFDGVSEARGEAVVESWSDGLADGIAGDGVAELGEAEVLLVGVAGADGLIGAELDDPPAGTADRAGAGAAWPGLPPRLKRKINTTISSTNIAPTTRARRIQ